MKAICRVWQNKGNKQLLITIPSRLGIKAGEFVKIKKVKL